MTPEDTQLARRARALYLDASRQLDPELAGRLRAARREALGAGPAASARRLSRLLLPAGAFAVFALAMLTLWHPSPHADGVPARAGAAAAGDADGDLPPDADSADPQLYQNLDFYDWLAASDRSPARH